MEEPVQNGRCGHMVPGEDIDPFLNGPVAGDHRASLHVPCGYKLKEQMGLMPVEGLVSQLIQDDQGIFDISPSPLFIHRVEIKRRTRVAMVFPNTESIKRLVSALFMEISQEWETNKIYIRLTEGMENDAAS